MGKENEYFVIMNPVKLITVNGSITAGTVEELLRRQGIPCCTIDRESGNYMKLYMGFTIYGIDFFVDESDYERAKELVAPFEEYEENEEDDGAGAVETASDSAGDMENDEDIDEDIDENIDEDEDSKDDEDSEDDEYQYPRKEIFKILLLVCLLVFLIGVLILCISYVPV